MKTKLVTEDIEFKRGQDSKKSLGVGMTIRRSQKDTIKRLEDAGFNINSLPAADWYFYISFNDYSIHFSEHQNGEKEWIFKEAHTSSTGERLYKTDNQKDLLEFTFAYFNDIYERNSFELRKKIKELEDARIRMLKSIESLNQ